MKYYCLYLFLFFLSNIHSQNLIEYETYKISSNKDTILITDFGTKIFIDKNSFIFKTDQKEVTDSIIIKIKEIVDQKDMLLEGISTNSDKGILTSNGMVLIEGYSSNHIVELKSNKSITIEIPANKGVTDMGVYTTTNDSLQNWEKEDIPLEIDTCASYKEQIIFREKTVSKSRYKQWKKEQTKSPNHQERLFGGRTIIIGKKPKKSYSIPVPIDTIWTCEDSELSYYSFNITSLGWYNIDKLRYKKRPIDLLVSTNEDLDIFLLFLDENICLRGTRIKEGIFEFGRIPRNKNVRLVAYRQNKDQTVNLVMKDFYLLKGKMTLDRSKKVSLGEFKRIIKIKN